MLRFGIVSGKLRSYVAFFNVAFFISRLVDGSDDIWAWTLHRVATDPSYALVKYILYRVVLWPMPIDNSQQKSYGPFPRSHTNTSILWKHDFPMSSLSRQRVTWFLAWYIRFHENPCTKYSTQEFPSTKYSISNQGCKLRATLNNTVLRL